MKRAGSGSGSALTDHVTTQSITPAAPAAAGGLELDRTGGGGGGGGGEGGGGGSGPYSLRTLPRIVQPLTRKNRHNPAPGCRGLSCAHTHTHAHTHASAAPKLSLRC